MQAEVVTFCPSVQFRTWRNKTPMVLIGVMTYWRLLENPREAEETCKIQSNGINKNLHVYKMQNKQVPQASYRVLRGLKRRR
jgi:hypothetical protein